MEVRAVIDHPVDLKEALSLLFDPKCPEHLVVKLPGTRMLWNVEHNDYTGLPFKLNAMAGHPSAGVVSSRQFELWKMDKSAFLTAVTAWFDDIVSEIHLKEVEHASRGLILPRESPAGQQHEQPRRGLNSQAEYGDDKAP